MSLAHRLKATRKKNGLSQSELANLVDVSQPTIANWERGGHIPRPDALSRIADVLKIDTTWLLSGEMPARHDPANQYLARPIQHVPVYNWPLKTESPTETQAVRYMPMSTDSDPLFALEAHVASEFPHGTILVFSRSDLSTPGRFLLKTSQGFELTEETSLINNVAARLIYAIVPY